MTLKWRTHNESIVYDNAWISVSHRSVTAPTGKDGIYGVVHFKNRAIAVIPIDADGNTWLVGQHRYPIDQYSWEIPEGGAVLDESLLGAARRELREETGIVAGLWTSLLHTHLSNSVSDESAFAFVAQHLSYTSTQPDDTELLDLKKLPVEDAVQMAMDGTITDSLSVICLLKLRLLIDNGSIIC